MYRRKKPVAEINVVPYIDVMLVFVGDFYDHRTFAFTGSKC